MRLKLKKKINTNISNILEKDVIYTYQIKNELNETNTCKHIYIYTQCDIQ